MRKSVELYMSYHDWSQQDSTSSPSLPPVPFNNLLPMFHYRNSTLIRHQGSSSQLLSTTWRFLYSVFFFAFFYIFFFPFLTSPPSSFFLYLHSSSFVLLSFSLALFFLPPFLFDSSLPSPHKLRATYVHGLKSLFNPSHLLFNLYWV